MEKNNFEQEIQIEKTESSSTDYDAEMRASRFSKHRSLSDIFTILCAGVALVSDGYQNSVMTMINAIFTQMYPTIYTSDLKTRVSNALLVGEVLGQILIGITCDYLGRKWAIISTTVLIILGSILCTAAHGVTTLGMFWMLIICRGAVGFGAGGEYPACSTAASEAANETTKRRGFVFVMATAFPLTIGGPLCLVIFLIIYKICGPHHLETVWRLLFGIGIIWPLSVFYFRFKMATSILYKKSAIKKNVPYLLVIKYYWLRLLGTCGCWFIFDFVTFPNGIFSATIISSVLGKNSDLLKIGEWNLLLSIIGLPGIIVGGWLMDVIGRKYTLIIGFIGYVVIGLVIGCAYEKLSKIVPLFIVLYGVFNFFGNLGPCAAVGLVASESFATPVRGTLYGLSAAVGKAGAAIGTQSFTPIQNQLGKKYTFIIAAVLGLLGVLLAWFCVPHLNEEDLMEEDINFEKYLRAKGWEGQFGLE